MIHFVVAFGVMLHVLLWGAGLATLTVPRAWRRFWPVLAAPAGLALQSLVVWIGASYTNLPGTNSYAWWSELVPLALLAVAWRERGARAVWTDASRFGVVAAAVAGCLGLLVLPLAIASKGLTTVSLASCDAPDYAAGARVLMEFAHGDRTGFLGLTEVVRVQSADNFFDYFLRLNHFTPSALIAFNGTVLHCAPHELTGIMTMVLLASSLPVVFWMARAVFGYSGGVSTGIAVIYGVNPVTWYAVAHVSPGQFLAAQAVALITWSGVALWRGRLDARTGMRFAGVLTIGYALVLGSYNFMLLVCLVPAVAYAGGLALWRGDWRRLVRWSLVMLAPLVLAGLGFAQRVAGLAERFTLLQQYDFGWKIPALTPEGWLGMVSGPALEPWAWGGLRWILSALVVSALVAALARALRLRRRDAWTTAAMSLPVLAGYLLLEARGARLGTNASYDAYKLFAVFYPLLLPACCWWVTLRTSQRLWEWFAVFAAGVVVAGFNLVAVAIFIVKLSQPPLMVTGELRQLRKIEAMPDVASVNVLLPDMWSRLWANAFLLKKPQYFLTDTYEGRWHTALKGEWDLAGGIIAVKPAEGGRKEITERMALVETKAPDFVRVNFGDGWHPEESDAKTGTRWVWTKGEATLRVENPHAWPLRVVVTLDGWSLGERDLMLTVVGETAAVEKMETRNLGAQRVKTIFPEIVVPPGGATVALKSVQPWKNAGAGETRMLGVCVFGVELAVKR